jgi:hypothetical protein
MPNLIRLNESFEGLCCGRVSFRTVPQGNTWPTTAKGFASNLY